MVVAMTETLEGWLERLASGEPIPGGGAAAAVNVAIGAALVSMVCALTLGRPRYAAHEAAIKAAQDRAAELRRLALSLADEDATAYAAVVAAYRLPKGTDAEQKARSEAVQQALALAAEVPLRTASAAAEVIGLAESVADRSNVNAISDLAAAAASARAGLEVAAINVRANIGQLDDEALIRRLEQDLAVHEPAVATAGRVMNSVRSRSAPRG